MIHPNMATTLGFVMTDAAIDCASICGEMLTRATHIQLQLADGGWRHVDQRHGRAAGERSLGRAAGSQRAAIVGNAITRVMESLAEQIAADGEGAQEADRHSGVRLQDGDDARQVARAIANSPLVKTAIAGSDPNWGRILSAAGYSGVAFDPRASISICRASWSAAAGWPVNFDEDELKQS